MSLPWGFRLGVGIGMAMQMVRRWDHHRAAELLRKLADELEVEA